MSRKFRMLLAAATAAAWSGYAAAASTSDLNAALFGLRPSAIGVDLSPSGKEVAYVTPAPGGEAVAFIANVQTGTLLLGAVALMTLGCLGYLASVVERERSRIADPDVTRPLR